MRRVYGPMSDEELGEWYEAWRRGEKSKAEIEREVGDVWSKGQGITRAWRDRLGLETQGVDPRDLYIEELLKEIESLKGGR